MKTVLIYRDELLPISETFVQAQASSLSRYKAQFVGVSRARESLTLPGDVIVALPNSSKGTHTLRRRLYYRTGFAPGFDRALRAAEASLIHAHFAPSGRNAARLAKQLDVPLVVTLHGHDVTTRQNYKRLYNDLWRRASLFICVSEFIRRQAITAGFPAGKLRVHHIGIDRDLFSPATDAKVDGLVLFVGRLVEKKGCTFLLRAMGMIKDSCPSSHLIVIGDGPLRSELEGEALSLKIRCTFLGSRPRDVVRKYLNRATVVCVPSITATNGDSEGLPTIIMEAMAGRTAVVSTEHAGIPEIVESGRTGMLVAERSPRFLADALECTLRDTAFRQACVEAGSEVVRELFDLKRQTQRLEELYDEVSCNGGAQGR